MASSEAKLELPVTPKAARIAREFVRRKFSGIGDEALDRVTLCVSELVTNALDHAAPPYELRVGQTPDRLRVEVADASTGRPTLESIPSPSTSSRGRGMLIVSQAATTWGVILGRHGKTVWAEIAS